jgi:tRNA(Ile)-lysidine synthase
VTPSPDNSRQQDFSEKFLEALDKLTENSQGQGLVAAFSGGADSTFLIYHLKDYTEKSGGRLTLAHLDHGLRGEAGERDRQSSERVAADLGLPFIGSRIDCLARAKHRRLSLEHAARQARYEFLEGVRLGTRSDWVVTGHTADDNAELVLMNLLRGSGPRGLAGIPPRRDRIIRPMLGIWRREISRYLLANGIAWLEDHTNKDTRFNRNRVRHELIPYLQSYNPAITASLARTADILQAEEAVWENQVRDAQHRVAWHLSGAGVTMDQWSLNHEPRGTARRLIREAYRCARGDIYELTLEHVDRILALAHSREQSRIHLPGRVCVRTQNGKIEMGFIDVDDAVSGYELPLEIPGEVILRETGFVLAARVGTAPSRLDRHAWPEDVAVMDYDRIEEPLTVRNARSGDRFQPLGMDGSKKVTDFFIDTRIPADERKRVPLILDRRRIIWVAGHRLSNAVRIGPETRRVLILELRRGQERSTP